MANGILSRQEIVDVLGHVSVRYNGYPDRILLSASIAPELVTVDDILRI